MENMTLTFSILNSQTPVELVEDPSKPSWDDILAARVENEQGDEQDSEECWDAFFAANKSHFETLAAQALAEADAGLTEDLDPEEL